ncbi:MAG: single-stranded DNA-binding protein [Oscillospiraceae bacterium]|nr:single-stranded DNA-binding protein [Oscillospiraceae bacterium]
MASFNKVILIGNMVADPELKTTPNSINVCSFRIAVGRRYVKSGEQQQTDFIDIVAWRAQAEFVAKYFSKGKPILVCGSIQSRNWQDKEGNKRTTVEVIADEVSFVERKSTADNFASGSANSGDPGAVPPPAYSTSYETAPKFEEISADDDLPF